MVALTGLLTEPPRTAIRDGFLYALLPAAFCGFNQCKHQRYRSYYDHDNLITAHTHHLPSLRPAGPTIAYCSPCLQPFLAAPWLYGECSRQSRHIFRLIRIWSRASSCMRIRILPGFRHWRWMLSVSCSDVLHIGGVFVSNSHNTKDFFSCLPASAPLDIYSHIKKGKAGIWRYFSRNTEQESIAPGSFRQSRVWHLEGSENPLSVTP